jgi:hypothetical protein
MLSLVHRMQRLVLIMQSLSVLCLVGVVVYIYLCDDPQEIILVGVGVCRTLPVLSLRALFLLLPSCCRVNSLYRKEGAGGSSGSASLPDT